MVLAGLAGGRACVGRALPLSVRAATRRAARSTLPVPCVRGVVFYLWEVLGARLRRTAGADALAECRGGSLRSSLPILAQDFVQTFFAAY